MSRTKIEQEQLEKTMAIVEKRIAKKMGKSKPKMSIDAKVDRYKTKLTKREERAARKADRKAMILRMTEVPPSDPNKPKPGEDKPSGMRMYLRSWRPIINPDGYTIAYVPELGVPEARRIPQANDKTKKTDGSSQIGGGTHGGADEAAIYEIHMPDHGDGKVYATSPKGAFRKAMKYMATYGKMLETMFPGGQGAQNRDQKDPKIGPHGNYPKPKPKDAEGLQVVNLGKSFDGDLVFKG